MRRAQAPRRPFPAPAPAPVAHRDLKPANVPQPATDASLEGLLQEDAGRHRVLDDQQLLEAVIAADEGDVDDGLGRRPDGSCNLFDGEREAFPDMLGRVRAGRTLTPKQRGWVERTAERLGVEIEARPAAPPDNRLVPRGREVPTPAALRRLPLAPPGRQAPPAAAPRPAAPASPEEQRWGPSWGFRQPAEEQPCPCGDEGLGKDGFHYPGAEGCAYWPPPDWLEPLARVLALPRERLVEAYLTARALEANAVVLRIDHRDVKAYRTPDGTIDNCALAAGEDPSTCPTCLHAEGGCPDGDRLHREMAERFAASRPPRPRAAPTAQLGLGFEEPGPRAYVAPERPRSTSYDDGAPDEFGSGDDEDDLPF